MKAIVLFLTMTFLNIGLTFILISILADGLLEYKTGFYVSAPFIIGFTIYILYFLYSQVTKFRNQIISSSSYSLGIILAVINIIFLLFNYSCWIDLYDGTTKALLP